jgi:hypothetical protein
MTTITINPASLKEQVSLSGLLEKLGFQPARKSGAELIYHSMLRDNDRTPSLSVNDELGAWYDHGTGKGGSLIDFGLAYWPALTFKEVLVKIWDAAQQTVPVMNRPVRRRKALKLPHYQVEAVKPLGSTEAISQYLVYRGVDTVATGLLEEVHYLVRDEKQEVKHFFAAGHRNESGGWEVRNKYFKGCLGRKGLTILANDPRKVSLFEGYFDFLSWKFDHPEASDTVIILNSVSLLGAALKVALQYPEIDSYFDHDQAGRDATRELIKALPYASDRSAVFKGCHDYNNLRKKQSKAERLAAHPPKRDLFEGIKIPFIR